jgi:hypothetical protein
MIKFKDFIKKKKLNVISWVGHHEIKKSIKENFFGKDYDKEFHDHPDVTPNGLTHSHITAINNFTSAGSYSKTGHSSSRNINGYLRNKEGSKDNESAIFGHTKEDVHAAVKNLSSAFTPQNTNRKEIVVHSGVPEHIGKTLKQSGEGSQHHIAGFTSTSSSSEVAHNFARNYGGKEHHVIEYHVKPGAGLSVAQHSSIPDENEVILHHGAKITYHGSTASKNEKGIVTHVHKVTVHNEHKPLEEYGEYKHPE